MLCVDISLEICITYSEMIFVCCFRNDEICSRSKEPQTGYNETEKYRPWCNNP